VGYAKGSTHILAALVPRQSDLRLGLAAAFQHSQIQFKIFRLSYELQCRARN
jgi:hypothetical protein